MNISFGSERQELTTLTEILLNGQVVGDIETAPLASDCNRYHAVIKVPVPAFGLLQGFGDTKENAAVDALMRGRDNANAVLAYIASLEKSISR